MSEPASTRRCAGCQQRYRFPSGHDPFCCRICAASAAQAEVLAALRRFAEAQATPERAR